MRDLRKLESQTTDPFYIYPHTERDSGNLRRSSTREKEKDYRKIMYPQDGNTSAYQRLKLVMDYWCALWYWPVDKADLLPHRTEYLGDLSAILAGKQTAATFDLFADRLERGFCGICGYRLFNPKSP